MKILQAEFKFPAYIKTPVYFSEPWRRGTGNEVEMRLFMHRRISNLAMVLSLSFCAAQFVCAPLAVSAQTPTQFAGSSPATGGTADSNPTRKPAKIKTVSFHVRNDAATPLVLQAGDQQFTIKSGETVALKLPEGASLTTVSGTGRIAPGALITTITKQLRDNTLAVS